MLRNPRMRLSSSKGFTLLEVLIALVIFSFGMLAMAGVLVLSVRVNQSAYLRTQAAFLAQSIADRMRANSSWALWTNLYNSPPGGWSAAQPGTATCQPGASPVSCAFGAIATRDIAMWTAQIARFLPNATESIVCAANASARANVPSATYQMLPPFSGLCTVTINWSETPLAQKTLPTTQTFAWTFQP